MNIEVGQTVCFASYALHERNSSSLYAKKLVNNFFFVFFSVLVQQQRDEEDVGIIRERNESVSVFDRTDKLAWMEKTNI